MAAALEEIKINPKENSIDVADPDLFKTPPIQNCAVCMLPMPYERPVESRYLACCGNYTCTGCMYESTRVSMQASVLKELERGEKSDSDDADCCPFCRAERPTSDIESVARLESRAKGGDENALLQLSVYYRQGAHGLQKDVAKSLELEHKAAELGSAKACHNLSLRYSPHLADDKEDRMNGIIPSKEKMDYYKKEAAKGGSVFARYDLGLDEMKAGNVAHAHRHWMISVARGDDNSLKAFELEKHFGRISEEKYSEIKTMHECGKEEMKSEERDRMIRSGFDLAKYIDLYFDDEAKAKAQQTKI